MTETQISRIIDFSEIETPHKFEQFAEDVLRSRGFVINMRPGEGPDGGRDMVVTDTLIGRVSKRTVKYLVSCKHQKTAVGLKEEQDIESRVRAHHCDAFMGFYSSHVTEGLNTRANGLKSNPKLSDAFDVILFQDADIKKILLELDDGDRLVRQWFPKGHARVLRELSDSKVFATPPVLRCSTCGTSLMERMSGSVLYDAKSAPADKPREGFEEDERYRPHIQNIRAFCQAHIPKEPLPGTSFQFRIQDMIEEPELFLKRFAEDAKFMYLWPPYFVEFESYRRWNRLVHVMFYFIARGRTRTKPASTSSGLLPLPGVQDLWELK